MLSRHFVIDLDVDRLQLCQIVEIERLSIHEGPGSIVACRELLLLVSTVWLVLLAPPIITGF